MKRMKKIKGILLLLAVFPGITLTACRKPEPALQESTTEETETVPVIPATVVTEPETLPPETEPEEEKYVISLAGDCTLGTNIPVYYADLGFIRTVGEDYGHPFRNVQCYFANDDLTLVNLEGPLVDDGYPIPNKKFNFRGPTDYVNILTEGSVEAVTLANNHTEDYGTNGYQSTLDTLNEAGIPYVERDSSVIITLGDNFKVGIYGAMFYKLDEDQIVSGITSLKEQGVDFIIFAVHWGTEYSYNPSTMQVSLAYAAIDAGADVVWGHHPHVLQPIEKYGNGIIFYSLGNFSFGGNTSPRDFDSAVIQLAITRSGDGTVRMDQVNVHPVCISSITTSNNYQPTPYDPSSAEYDRVMEKLNWSPTETIDGDSGDADSG